MKNFIDNMMNLKIYFFFVNGYIKGWVVFLVRLLFQSFINIQLVVFCGVYYVFFQVKFVFWIFGREYCLFVYFFFVGVFLVRVVLEWEIILLMLIFMICLIIGFLQMFNFFVVVSYFLSQVLMQLFLYDVNIGWMVLMINFCNFLFFVFNFGVFVMRVVWFLLKYQVFIYLFLQILKYGLLDGLDCL